MLFGVGAMAVGTSLGIGAMLDKAMNASIALSNFTAETGLSAQTLQLWQHVFEGVGGTADEATASIQAMQDALTKAKIYGGGPVWSQLGINPLLVKDVWHELDILREKIASGRYSPTMMTSFLRDLGAAGPMMKVLTTDFNRWSNREAVIPKEWSDRAVRFNANLKELGQTITYLFAVAFANLEPEMTRIVSGIETWLKGHQKILVQWITDLSKGFGAASKGLFTDVGTELSKVFKLVDKLSGNTTGVQRFVTWSKIFGDAILLLSPAVRVLTSIADALAEIYDLLYGEGDWMQKLAGAANLQWSHVAKIVTEPGVAIGEKIGNMFPNWFKMGLGAEIFRTGASLGLTPLMLRPSYPAPSIKHYNIKQEIHSNADARTVAEISAREIQRVINLASAEVA